MTVSPVSPWKPFGVDVSNHQGFIDWGRVRDSGHIFGFAKASEGDYFRDAWFDRNWNHMRDVGIYRGAYHFARPSSGLPEDEAAFFLRAIQESGGLHPGDLLVLDMEDEKYTSGGPYGSAGAWSLGFCQYIEADVGFKPLIYTGKWYSDSRHLADTPELGDYALWLAAYTTEVPTPPAPWSVLSFWQFTDKAHVPGIPGLCDRNLFNGEAGRIPLLGMPGEVPPEEPEYIVGPGILEAMHNHGDSPASNEHYPNADWSEAFGKMGWRYVYIKSLNTVKVFRSDDD